MKILSLERKSWCTMMMSLSDLRCICCCATPYLLDVIFPSRMEYDLCNWNQSDADSQLERPARLVPTTFITPGTKGTGHSIPAQVNLLAIVRCVVNSVWVLGFLALFLIPLPFTMRRPGP